MPHGRIISIFPERGFGLVQVAGSDQEIYFHASAISAGLLHQLVVGQSVSFEIMSDPRDDFRQQAVNLVLTEKPR